MLKRELEAENEKLKVQIVQLQVSLETVSFERGLLVDAVLSLPQNKKRKA